MKALTRILVATVLGAVLLALSGQKADAGRTGGSASETVTIPAYQFAFFTVPFDANAPAIVSVVGDRNAILELAVRDADGHITTGTGPGYRRTAVINVYRPGNFRVEVRNSGPKPSTVVVTTN